MGKLQHTGVGCERLRDRETIAAAERRRRLARVYRLILNYNPQAEAPGQDEVGPIAPQVDESQRVGR